MGRVTPLLEHFEKRHVAEIERRERLDSSISLPMTILTLEIGFFAFYLEKAIPLAPSLLSVAFYVLLLLSLVLFIAAVYFVFRSITGYEMAFTASPQEMESYYERTYRYLQAARKQGAHVAAHEVFERELQKQYLECAEINIYNNDRKAYNIRRAKVLTIASVIVLATTLVPFLTFGYLHPRDNIQKIEIINHNP